MVLHIINRSPYNSETLNTCIAIATPGSAILMTEDGVYASNNKHSIQTATAANIVLYALKEDSEARGVIPDQCVKTIDYTGFVDLVCQHTSSHSWL